MKRALVALGLALGLVIGSAVTPGAMAQAGTCTLWLCGEVRVSTYSAESIRVTYTWGDVYATDRWVAPGHNSAEYGKDTDGFQVQSGTDIVCTYNSRYIVKYTTTGWVKIQDDQRPTCRVYRT